MKIIIAMAGEGSRFKKVGIEIPKHEIFAGGKTLFEWSMLSLKDFFNENFIFITRRKYYNRNFIKKECSKIGINNYVIHEIDYLTDGQASTVMCADELIENNDEVLIYNIDTYVKEYSIKKVDIKDKYFGFIPVFKSEGDKWSFVKVDKDKKVVDVAEKVRISNLGSIGLYYFRTWSKFKSVYNSMKKSIKDEFHETYIAPMYKELISQQLEIGVKVIDETCVHVLGTPEDVEKFKFKMGFEN